MAKLLTQNESMVKMILRPIFLKLEDLICKHQFQFNTTLDSIKDQNTHKDNSNVKFMQRLEKLLINALKFKEN